MLLEKRELDAPLKIVRESIKQKDFVQNIEKKGGEVYFSYPCFQQASFDKSGDYIHALDSTLQETSIKMMNSPERYRIPDEECFDTFYHLIQTGVERRTNLLIERSYFTLFF